MQNDQYPKNNERQQAMNHRIETLAEGVTLHLGDCREIMATLPAESVDMVWTDPPYGHANHDGDFNARLNEHRGIENKPIANDDGDGMREVVDAMLIEAARVLRADCCCCCCCGGGGPRPTFAWVADRMDRGGFSFFHSVIWDKVNPGLGWRYRRQHEMVMVAHRAGGKLLWANDKRAVPNIYSEMPSRERSHPNEKPLQMVSHFLRLHAKPGQLVVDPFMGSGTTGVAAVRAGMRFTGIEIDPTHFETAIRRIRGAVSAPDMFAQIDRRAAEIQEGFDLPIPPEAQAAE
jgi:site-specific DNA-methyltransferase (adenine-specific)